MGIVTALSDTNYGRMPLSEYSLTFGESISKVARHRLCLLCLDSIERDLNNSSESDAYKGRGRGRPLSIASLLAIQIGVSYDTVKRWQDPSAIQSCDSNAERLAQIALTYNREETIEILRQDLELRRAAIETWITQRTPQAETGAPNIIASPCVENAEVEEGS